MFFSKTRDILCGVMGTGQGKNPIPETNPSKLTKSVEAKNYLVQRLKQEGHKSLKIL